MSNSYTEVVEQAISLLRNLSKTEYQKVIQPHFPSSIGAHIRHIVDHFNAIKEADHTHHINYNIRHRHNQVEHCPSAAIESLINIKQWLMTLSAQACKAKVMVTTEINISHTESATCESTIERELVFVSSHAIHHYALIRIICGMQNITIPKFFGYAPATITHMTKSA